MREPIDFDWLERFDASLTGASPQAHAAAANELLTWAEQPHPEDEAWPGDLVLRAAFQLSSAGDTEGALGLALRAAEQGISEGADPRAFAAELLFQLARPEEAKEISEELRRSRPHDPATYWTMATIWESREELTQALAWSNRGIALVEEVEGPPADLGLLCSGRWRIRQALGHEPDELDELGMGFDDAVANHVEDAQP